MDPRLTLEAVEAMVAERRRAAAKPRRRTATGEERSGPSEPAVESVTVRPASAADTSALERLAQLDSRPAPSLPALVAEANGEIVAAMPTAGGQAVADPFRRTAEVVRLLELRSAQLTGVSTRRRRRLLRPPGRRRSTGAAARVRAAGC